MSSCVRNGVLSEVANVALFCSEQALKALQLFPPTLAFARLGEVKAKALCCCFSDARELGKLNFVFEGSTLVSASFCRVLHCLAVL